MTIKDFQETVKTVTRGICRKRHCSAKKINEGLCFDWATEVFSLVWDRGCKICGHNGHAYIEYRGRFYDSETPHGVKRWRRLPFFVATNTTEEIEKLRMP